AYAFCAWAGKRLCGRVDTRALAIAELSSAFDAWYVACSAEGTRVYPYGDTFDPTACNGLDRDAGGRVMVGTLPRCVGGYPGLFDMAGNVAEWIDACDDAGLCAARGGGFAPESGEERFMRCSHPGYPINAAATYSSIGFRCCSL